MSSHGLDKNQLTLRKYPSTVKITELTWHISRVLHMPQVWKFMSFIIKYLCIHAFLLWIDLSWWPFPNFCIFRALMGTQLYQLQQMKHSGFGKFLEPPIPQRMITLKTQKWLSTSFILTSTKIYGITMDVRLKVVINVLFSL